jgi:hypothetical protein
MSADTKACRGGSASTPSIATTADMKGVTPMKTFRLLSCAFAFGVFGSAASALCPAPPVGNANDSVLKMAANSTTAGLGSVASMGKGSREEGSVVYDPSDKRLAICDGTNWKTLNAGGTGDPLESCKSLPVGGRCSDGTYYVGTTLGRRMYIAPNDEPGMYAFRELHDVDSKASGYGSYDEVWELPVSATDNDGYANTKYLSFRENAGWACKKKGRAWFLPARNEMLLITSRSSSIPAANISGSREYWTSTSSSYPGKAIHRDEATMVKGSSTKTTLELLHYPKYVRCARLDLEEVD